MALRHASEAEEVGEPALAHLAAAEAAELAGDIGRAEAEYERLRGRPDTVLIGLRGLIGLAEGRGDIPAAILSRQARKRWRRKSPSGRPAGFSGSDSARRLCRSGTDLGRRRAAGCISASRRRPSVGPASAPARRRRRGRRARYGCAG